MVWISFRFDLISREATMPYADARGARLYYEEAGSGFPIVFVHEFAGDMRSWEPQVRYFARMYRCITYNARGYPPSDVPEDAALYGQDIATDDIATVMRAAGVAKAHIVGLSMGGFATAHFGIRYPESSTGVVRRPSTMTRFGSVPARTPRGNALGEPAAGCPCVRTSSWGRTG
jgi:pimeloyl-ACP methyl ester carboxylesterase